MRISLKAIALVLASLAGAAPARAADTLRVGKPEATGFAFAILDVGVAEGIFEQNGVAIESFDFAGAGKSHQALVAGSIDIELGAGVELAYLAKGSPAKAVAATAGPPASMGILVRMDGSADRPSDLKGKRIAVSTAGSLTWWLATAFARQQGWGTDGVVPTAIGSIDAELAALLSKSVDGMVGPVGRGLLLESQGRAKVLVQFGDSVPLFLTHIILASDKAIAAHPDALRRFLKGWFETIAFMRAHKGESIRITAPITRLPFEFAARDYDIEMPMFFTDGHFDPELVTAMEQALVEIGQLDAMPENAKIITEKFLP